jgi:spoIIIJ-associated protein
MAKLRASVEIIAPSVEEAVERGARELGLEPEELEVEVLDEGSKGLFGLGSRQSRVRLTVRDREAEAEQAEVTAAPEPEPPAAPAPPEREPTAPTMAEEPPSRVEVAPPTPADISAEQAEIERVTRETVAELLERMGFSAEIQSHWGEPDAPGETRYLHVDVEGDNLGALIGRKSETLSAFQYITRLIVGKELEAPAPVIVDVDGYRARREDQLRRMARQMAKQAVDQNRTMRLEPMPPNERRIIHIELRENDAVTTESIGEGDRRKVTIIPTQS